MNKVVTRFAPSPTGFMHVGGARTALYAWLYAKKNGGTCILRIEDTDKEREVDGSIPHIIEALSWIGLSFDEGPHVGGSHAPYLQSERLPLYKKYAQKLIDAGCAYPDPYTAEELAAFRAQAETEKRPFLFRDHRPKTEEVWDGTKPLRFKTPTIKRFVWHDAVRGELSAGEEALDDFIILKSDGYPTYNFAHIVDDIEMGVTHVLRGEEFISSTPKFLSLYEALGIVPPVFATLPAILGESGTKKLSKRDGAKDLLDYRAEGYLPEAMMNFLALLGWHPKGEEEFFRADALAGAFELERVQKSGAMFDDEKLLHINQHWMRALPDADFVAHLDTAGKDAGMVLAAVPLLKDRAKTFKEAQEMLNGELAFLFATPVLEKVALLAKEPTDTPGITATHLEAVLDMLSKNDSMGAAEDIKTLIMPYADEKGRAAVLWPLRYTLSGQERSPDPFTLIALLGIPESLLRIRAALGILK